MEVTSLYTTKLLSTSCTTYVLINYIDYFAELEKAANTSTQSGIKQTFGFASNNAVLHTCDTTSADYRARLTLQGLARRKVSNL